MAALASWTTALFAAVTLAALLEPSVAKSSSGKTSLLESSENLLFGPADAAGNLFKVALTQKNYIQFLKYEVDFPPLEDFAFCLWLRSTNFTNSHPIFSYSRHETERLAQAWLEPASAINGFTAHARLSLLGIPVFSVPLSEPSLGPQPGGLYPWLHVCYTWDGRLGTWRLFLHGQLAGQGHAPAQLRGLKLPPGGDVVVGQEYTDQEKGLDDGIEGELFGFNLLMFSKLEWHTLQERRSAPFPWYRRYPSRPPGRISSSSRAFQAAAARLVHSGFEQCAQGRGSIPDAGLPLLVAWARSPVKVFGGAVLLPARPVCGHF
ncbi:uncharacterized protein LOC126426663 [Schistocerca serialis cubense]|uniref:uncharacterized protein LOC126426663 n=1 Tax=Schistocerca serialis cubense TaxID=2023355 RepID=UPI00214E2700|nr:uncharacterized protein LOC126426663 [Schistocerca serialis cubense]